VDVRERVWLVCQHVPGSYEAMLNGQVIGADDTGGTFAADISDRLQHRNTIVFAVASPEPLGDVWIEIRTANMEDGTSHGPE
jgi:hypothetical protein